MTLFRVYYSEIEDYEDYIDANTKEQAEEIFKSNLENELIEPLSCLVEELSIEEIK